MAPAPIAAAGVEPVMRARQVNKVFGATHALRGVDLDLRPGRVVALFGENGAGKSTLMKVLAGIEQPTTGSIELDGEPVVLGSPREAADRGVVIIHQELSLFGNLSIADNLFLGRERRRAGGTLVDERAERAVAAELLARLEEPLDPRTPVGSLRLGQQQLVEIARALVQDTRVLIMDEPTSALSTAEVEVLFRVIRDLTAEGVAIVYISHHIEEALEIADDVVVMRDGGLVETAPAADVDLAWIVERMVGRTQDELFTARPVPAAGSLLQVRSLTVADPETPGRSAVDDLSFSVGEGEVVGLYGLMGAGRTELLETIAGRIDAAAGELLLDGTPLTGDVGARIAQGVALVPEDRQRDGLVPTMTVAENMSLAGLGRFVRRGLVHRASETEAIERMVADLTVKTASPHAPIGSLSGGNQQKVVIGRALLTHPRVLLLDEPTRGIDVGAKADIFALIAQLAEQGLAVVFATSEIEEALHVPDRLLVLSRGRLARELTPANTTREEIMAASEIEAEGVRA